MSIQKFKAKKEKTAKPEKKVESPKPKEEKKKKEKKASKEEDDDDFDPTAEALAEEKPKAPNPLDQLPPSKLNMNDWKKMYSNNDTRTKAIPWFWEHFDRKIAYKYCSSSIRRKFNKSFFLAEGYCIYRVDYKYNDELTRVFMSSNLISGFFTRLESARKYAFGSMLVTGEDNKSEIGGYFVHLI